MIAAFVFLLSLVTFFQFFISYCHAAVSTARGIEVSETFRGTVGMGLACPAEVDITRVDQLARLIPNLQRTPAQTRVVNFYHNCLRVAARVAQPTIPCAPGWIDGERKSCAHFLAVILDQRVSANRSVLAQEMGAL